MYFTLLYYLCISVYCVITVSHSIELSLYLSLIVLLLYLSLLYDRCISQSVLLSPSISSFFLPLFVTIGHSRDARFLEIKVWCYFCNLLIRSWCWFYEVGYLLNFIGDKSCFVIWTPDSSITGRQYTNSASVWYGHPIYEEILSHDSYRRYFLVFLSNASPFLWQSGHLYQS